MKIKRFSKFSIIKRNIRKEAEKNYNPDKIIESLEKDSKQFQFDSKKAKKKADEALKRGNEKEYFYCGVVRQIIIS